MAGEAELDYIYSQIDRIFRLNIGETGDFSGARYDGDFSLSLEQAQRRKHEFIAKELGIRSGSRVLDMGCGWGPLLAYLREIGAEGVGLTLSRAQAAACRKRGFDVRLRDCRVVEPSEIGNFDAIASLGAFEHFCSFEEWRNGRQESIYREFFRTVAGLLPTGGRFYLQTMVYGRNMIDHELFDINAARDSSAYVLAVMERQFPGSWLPSGAEQIERCASPFFREVSKSSGRLDYIETITQWGRRYRRFGARKYLVYASLIPRYLTDRDFRERLSGDQVRANIECFRRELFDHFRIVFEKI